MENQTNILNVNTLHSGNYQVNLQIAKALTPFKEPKDFQHWINYLAAVDYLHKKGLTLILNKGNLSRGTIGIVDPLTKRKFSITKAGYIRTYKYYKYYGVRTYQLNPRNTHSPIGYSESRVTFPLEYNYMATLLWKTIKNIRKNK